MFLAGAWNDVIAALWISEMRLKIYTGNADNIRRCWYLRCKISAECYGKRSGKT